MELLFEGHKTGIMEILTSYAVRLYDRRGGHRRRIFLYMLGMCEIM